MAKRSRISARLRREVVNRARSCCEYCQMPQWLCPTTFEVDHIVPVAAGGNTSLDNLCFACPNCNSAKQSQTEANDPVTKRRVSLFDPRRHEWERHFQWSNDGLYVVAKTAIGRVTIEALAINRSEVIPIRLLWTVLGVHPPQAN